MSGLALDHAPTTGDEVISNYTINFGPQHPAAHGVLRLVMDSTARSSSGSTRTSACSTAAPRS